MSYYALNKNIGLRSWHLVPNAYYMRGVMNAEYISKEKFDVLAKCDSNHNIEDSDLLNELIEDKFIFMCKKGEHPFDKWQYKICDNRYFPAMNLMITGKCNYNCLHCFNAVDNNPLADEFTMEEINKLLDEAEMAGINAFTITGGEPMLHKNFFDIIEGIYKRGMYVGELNTNGYFINQESLDRLKTIGADPLVKISFDGIGYHDWMRNKKGAEEKTLDAIKICLDNGFKVKIQTNVNKHNLDSMIDTINLMDDMGVNEIRIIRTTITPRWQKNTTTETFDFLEYYDAMLNITENIIRKKELNIQIDFWNFLDLYTNSKCYSIAPVMHPEGEYRDSFPVCLGTRGLVAISASGNLYPCLQMSGYFDAHHICLGNVKKEGLIKLLQSGKYLDCVCFTVGELAQKNEKCRNCKYFKYCCGGCRALALSIHEDYLAEDSAKCLFYKNGYYDKIIDTLDGWQNLTQIEQ